MVSKSTTQALPQQWRQHIDEWRKSGLSQQAFCRDQDLSYHNFTIAVKLAHMPASKASPRTSVRVPVAYQSPSTNNGLSVYLPNGISLRGIASDILSMVELLLETLR